jgi:hypothetical protein
MEKYKKIGLGLSLFFLFIASIWLIWEFFDPKKIAHSLFGSNYFILSLSPFDSLSSSEGGNITKKGYQMKKESEVRKFATIHSLNNYVPVPIPFYGKGYKLGKK